MRTPKDQLGTRLTEVLATQARKMVFLAAARNMTYGDVVTLMDIIRTSGATSIGLVTDDKVADGPLLASGS